MLDSIKHHYLIIVSSNKVSFLLKWGGGAYSAGGLVAKFCSYPGAFIRVGAARWHWAVITSFTAVNIKLQKGLRIESK